MSTYRFRADNDNTLRIRTYADSTRVWASIGTPYGDIRGLHIPNADVPTVALELLKAAGQESVIVPAPVIGEVTEDGDHLMINGKGYVRMDREFWEGCNKRETASLGRFAHANAITRAILAFYDDKDGREAAAKSQLAERRNRIAAELAMGEHASGACTPGAYSSAKEPMKRAIDRIIELEDGASRD